MDDDQDIEREERGIYLVILGAMIPIVFGTLYAHDVFDAGSTISLMLLVLAVFGLFSRAILHRAPRGLPRAHVEHPPR
jgi:predicted membrane channel-forming protein YqfA (hemolysin III family)